MQRLLEISDKTLGLLVLMALAALLLIYLERTTRVPILQDGMWANEQVVPAVQVEP